MERRRKEELERVTLQTLRGELFNRSHIPTAGQMFDGMQSVWSLTPKELGKMFGQEEKDKVLKTSEIDELDLTDAYLTTIFVQRTFHTDSHSWKEVINKKAPKLNGRSLKEVFVDKDFEYLIDHYENLFSWAVLG